MDKKEQLDELNPESFSLQSIGAYMMFEEVEAESTKNLAEFLIKSNFIFPKDMVLTLLINSPGGDLYDGFGVIDLMECSRLEIQTVAIGCVASMGAMIFTAGSKGRRVMSNNSYIMTHHYSAAMEGKFHEFIAHRTHEDELNQRFVQHFVKHSKMTEKQVREILIGGTDNWMNAKDALKYGLCDRIQDPWS